MRLFCAIDVPPEIVERVTAAQAKLAQTRAAVRWVPAHQMHITIKFLADVPEELRAEIATRLTRAAAEVPAFELEIEGLGRFPERGPARTIISRVLSPDQRLTKLHRLIDSALGGIGLPLDTRALVPHLTLGRVSSNHGLNRLLRLLEKHDLDFFGAFTVAHITLFSSVLGSEGAVHTPIHTAPLAVPADAQS
jgi:2'-5' RNA ligase